MHKKSQFNKLPQRVNNPPVKETGAPVTVTQPVSHVDSATGATIPLQFPHADVSTNFVATSSAVQPADNLSGNETAAPMTDPFSASMFEVPECRILWDVIDSNPQVYDWRDYCFKDKDFTPLSANDTIRKINTSLVADHYFADIQKSVTIPITLMRNSSVLSLTDYQQNKISLDRLKNLELEQTETGVRCFLEDHVAADGRVYYQALYQFREIVQGGNKLYEKSPEGRFIETEYKASHIGAPRLSLESREAAYAIIRNYQKPKNIDSMPLPQGKTSAAACTQQITLPKPMIRAALHQAVRKENLPAKTIESSAALPVTEQAIAIEKDYYLPVIGCPSINPPDAEIQIIGNGKFANHTFVAADGETLEMLMPVTNAQERSSAVFVDAKGKKVTLEDMKTLVIDTGEKNVNYYYIVSHLNETGDKIYKEIGRVTTMHDRYRKTEMQYFIQDASGAMLECDKQVATPAKSKNLLSDFSRQFLAELQSKKQKVSEYVPPPRKRGPGKKTFSTQQGVQRPASTITTLPQTMISQLEAWHQKTRQERELAELSKLLGIDDPVSTEAHVVTHETTVSNVAHEPIVTTSSPVDGPTDKDDHKRKRP